MNFTKSDKWRNKPASEKQISLLDSLGIPWDEDISRGEASDLITEASEDAHLFSEDALQP